MEPVPNNLSGKIDWLGRMGGVTISKNDYFFRDVNWYVKCEIAAMPDTHKSAIRLRLEVAIDDVVDQVQDFWRKSGYDRDACGDHDSVGGVVIGGDKV